MRRFRIRAFDVVVLPRFMHRMQFYPFTFKELRDLDCVQRAIHLHSLQLPTTTARAAMSIASKFVSISDRADISMAASLIGMLGSRMVEHRRAAVYHLARWLQEFEVSNLVDVLHGIDAIPTVFGALSTRIPSASNPHQFVPVVLPSGGGVPAAYISRGRKCTRRVLWPWGPVFSVLAQAGLSLRSKAVDAALSSGAPLSAALFSVADTFALGSYRDFRLVKTDGTLVKFARLHSRITELMLSARKACASLKYTLNDNHAHTHRAAPLMTKLFSRLKLFSGRASSVHMLDLARANAWPHLSARTSQEISGGVPPQSPCSFCLKNLPQTTVHCLVSGSCSEFQALKVERHTRIVLKLVQFLRTHTPYSHVVSVESKVDPGSFKSNGFIKHNQPDVIVQDPNDGAVLVLDVTVVSPSRLAHAYSDKVTKYTPLSDLVEARRHYVQPSANLVLKPESCEVIPVVFSVFGDFHDESFSSLKRLVHQSSTADLSIAPFLSASCIEIAACALNASAVASASSKLYASNRRMS